MTLLGPEAVAGGLNLAHFACTGSSQQVPVSWHSSFSHSCCRIDLSAGPGTFGHARLAAWAVRVEPSLLAGVPSPYNIGIAT